MTHPKIKGIPPIYYLNLDHRTERLDYIEDQFKKYGIENYTRISASRYDPQKYYEWKSKIVAEEILTEPHFMSVTVNRIQSIVDWYYYGDSEVCLMIEDDLSFDTIEYWKFDWNTFFSNLPCNWDCVQLHIIGERYISMFFSPWTRNNHAATCIMITRSYAEKLIKLHYDDGVFKFHTNYGFSKRWPKYHYQSGDFIPFQIGVTYSIPLFISNSTFISDGYLDKPNYLAKKSDNVVLDWWKNKSMNYTMDDIMYLDTPKRKELLLKF